MTVEEGLELLETLCTLRVQLTGTDAPNQSSSTEFPNREKTSDNFFS
jgi:hypothetical protein